MPDATEIAREHLLWLLGSLCGVLRIPFDPALAAQACPPPCTLAAFHALARRLGLRTEARDLAGLDWRRLPLPAIAFLRPAAEAQADAQCAPEAAPAVPALILRCDGERLLCFRAGSQVPETLRVADLPAAVAPEVVVVARDPAAATAGAEAPPDPALAPPRFGFRWFVPELLRHRRIWRDVLLASLALQLVGLATPVFTQVIIDKVVVHHTQSTLVVVGVALAMFAVFTAAMSWLRQYLVLHTGNRIDAVLGSEVFRHLLHLPLPYFEQRPTGTLVARLHGVETLREFVSGAAVALLLDLPFLLLFLAVMFAYSWQLSLIALALLGLIALVGLLATPAFRARLDRQFLAGARAQAFLTEYVGGMGTVKALQMEPDLDRKYGGLLAQSLAASFSTRQVANGCNVAASFLEQLTTLSILVVGALLVMRNDGFTVGMLVAFQMFAGRMTQPMLRLAGLWQEFQQASLAVRRLGDILDLPQEPHSLAAQRQPAAAQAGGGRLDIQGLGFRYTEHHPWLHRQLDLRFQPGRISVITGPSGCGKSTLAKLLLGFYPPTEGRITLDGTDIRHLAANQLRSAFGVVPQETVLFSGSVYDNLALAHPHASFDDIVAACRAAEIHDTIEQLPQGYQTPIGERGTGLSGGQRQRIAIARALLKRPKILVFDEAVANLDQPTAEQLARTINQLRGRATILFITHQVPRALQVDEVFTLGGRPRAPRMEVVDEPEPREAKWAT